MNESCAFKGVAASALYPDRSSGNISLIYRFVKYRPEVSELLLLSRNNNMVKMLWQSCLIRYSYLSVYHIVSLKVEQFSVSSRYHEVFYREKS